jgi:molybdopterin synthase catalytic subunit
MDTTGVPGWGFVTVSEAAIDAEALIAAVSDPGAGAVVLFLGTVRDHSPGRRNVTGLEYEAYREVVEAHISATMARVREQHPFLRAAAAHRVGTLAVGETSVGVAVSAEHRPEAFAAAHRIIDELKASAPIWKKEHWEGGAEWVGNEP